MTSGRSNFPTGKGLLARLKRSGLGTWELSGYTRGRRLRLTPAQTLVVLFAVLVGVGTTGYLVLPGLHPPGVDRLNWVDALFTSTSAVCVTGLVVVDTATYFSFRGQLWTLLLVQAGGLGMIGLASIIIVTFNARLSLRHAALAGNEGLASQSMRLGGHVAAENVPLVSLVRDVVVFTLVAEGVGAVLLWALWWNDFATWQESLWHAVFTSVSAFCNAGFSTFSDSMVGQNARPVVLLVVAGGVMVGSLGFLTLEELKLWVQGRRSDRAFRLSLHTRLVLVTWFGFLLGGWFLFGVFEWFNPNTLGGMSQTDKLANALFVSLMPRTAGFNSIDYSATLPATQFTTILFMAVGGAPGGTSGGMKVTTVAIMAVMAYSRLHARRTTDLWDRTIPPNTAQRAVGLFAFAFTAVTLGVLLMTITELGGAFEVDEDDPFAADRPWQFLDYMFEAASAFNTCGLSTGPTGDLSTAGRLLAVVLMFVGRVGPLTFAAALSRTEPANRALKRYAHEDVVVG